MKEKENKSKKGSALLDHMIQRNISSSMQNVDDKVIAQAIKTLLMKDDNKYMN
nr:hypothetical protein [uncultured Cellulosilyticum sp.]